MCWGSLPTLRFERPPEMNAFSVRFAVLTLAVICGAVLAAPAPATPRAPEAEAAPDAERPPSVFAGTSIGVVLEANDNEVPRNGEEMMKTLAKVGDVAQLPVTFSAVAMDTGLSAPRVVVTF